jgi:hypothetical protein
MSKRRTPEMRYQEKISKQKKELEEFAAHEEEWADDLLLWYSVKKLDMPDDQYRAAAFFKNHEYRTKPGSLTLLFQIYHKLGRELPAPTKETAFDLLAYRYKVYALTLKKGGYDGAIDW